MNKNIKSIANKFFKDFNYFLKNTYILFKQNFKEVTIFILFCASFSMLATSILKNLVFDLMMKVSNTTYISPINLKDVFLNPGSIVLLLLFIVTITFIALFEIAGLLHAFSMGQVGRDTNLTSMVMAGLRTCKKALHPKNWLLIIFIMVLFPLTKLLPLSSSTFKVVLPGFVNQTIDYTKSLSIIYNIVYSLLLCVTVIYIFSINIFVLQKSDFTKSCDRSRRLGKGHYIETFLTMALLTLLLNFGINSLASIIIINVREIMALFEKNSGVVSKSAQIGNYTYFLRQILKSLISPAVNNAALTVLFYRYIEERELLGALSADVFKEVKSTKKTITAFVTAIVVIVGFASVYLYNKYSFLAKEVTRPYVCAHRGDNVNAPENTMPAFQLAVSENLSWIELDVHQTSDGVIICNHDSDISRVTGVNYSIHEHTYDEIKDIELGDWMPGNYQHVTLPKLEDVLLLAKENGLNVQVELKGHPDDINYEENVLKAINDTGMHDNVMIIAQDGRRLMRIKELDPTITKGYCMFIALGRIEDIDYTDNVTIEETNVTPELVERLHNEGKKVFCWTVDLEDTIQYLVSCDVDVIGTDNPILISSALDKVNYSGGLTRAFHIFMNAIANMDK